ncbi:unnamed protein product, partial [Symbiodinium microadriaticum]
LDLLDLNKLLQKQIMAYISLGMERCAAKDMEVYHIAYPGNHFLRMRSPRDLFLVPRERLHQVTRSGVDVLTRLMNESTNEEAMARMRRAIAEVNDEDFGYTANE